MKEKLVDGLHYRTCPSCAAHLERIRELEQQVVNLEEYMLKGVAFRDELQARSAQLEKVAEAVDLLIWHVTAHLGDKRYKNDVVEAYKALCAAHAALKEGK